MQVTYTVDVNIDEVWGNVIGGHSGYWADNFKTLDGREVAWYKDENYEQPNPQSFKVLADGEWYTVSERSLAEAFVKLKVDGWTHCGGDLVDEQDACTGDAILQVAAFGDFVYG